MQRGLVRVDRQGLADGPAYHPLHPEVRQAMKRRVESSAAGDAGGRVGLAGLLIQLGPGPTLLGTPDTGMDDDTFARFVQETFGPETAEGIPGLGTTDPEPVRRAVEVPGRRGPDALADLAIPRDRRALCRAGRGRTGRVARRDAGAGDAGPRSAARRAPRRTRVDLAGLAPSQAWRSVGLDLEAWPTGPSAPIVLRGVELSTDPLAHDLATSPDLDAKVASRPHRGLFLTIGAEPANPTARRTRAPPPRRRPDGDDEAGRPADRGHRPGGSGRRRVRAPS